jgi:hypothetical protein
MPELIQIQRAAIHAHGTDPWQDVSAEDFVRHVEGSGYVSLGTSLLILHELGELQTPTAAFRMKGGKA